MPQPNGSSGDGNSPGHPFARWANENYCAPTATLMFSGGIFFLASELYVNNDAISGYLKPFFKDIQVYDKSTGRDQGVGHQPYEMIAGGATELLENRRARRLPPG